MSLDEEEEFKRRKETGPQKSMNDYTEKFNQYKESLKKRTSQDLVKEEQDIRSDAEGSSQKYVPPVYTVKRLKTDYENDCEQQQECDDMEESESQEHPAAVVNHEGSSERRTSTPHNDGTTNITLKRREFMPQTGDRSERAKKLDPL